MLVIGNVGITMAQAVPKFTVNFKDASLMEVLDYLGKNSDYTFTYNSENVKNETAKITPLWNRFSPNVWKRLVSISTSWINM